MSPNHDPFPNDLAYLLAEVEWMRARCKRIDVQTRLREAEEDAVPHPRTVGQRESSLAKEYRRRLPGLVKSEEALRKAIDHRVTANRESGPDLAIDEVCEEFGLNVFERGLLLLACLPCLGRDYSDALNGVSGASFGGGSLAVENAWSFFGMTGEDRVKSRESFVPTAPLLREGLVVLNLYGTNVSPASLASTEVQVTTAAFARLVGMPSLATASSPKELDEER